MFRLTAYGDQPELYRYLSSIASNSIGQALDDWFGTPYELEEVYLSLADDISRQVLSGVLGFKMTGTPVFTAKSYPQKLGTKHNQPIFLYPR